MTNDNRSPSEMLNRYQQTNFEIETNIITLRKAREAIG